MLWILKTALKKTNKLLDDPSVIFEDNHVLLVFKPAGMLTQPDETQALSLEAWAKNYIKTAYAKPGDVFLHAIHRLDKPVSGLVLFARTSKSLERLNASMRAKLIKKTYIAQIQGHPPHSQGTLEHFLYHSNHQSIVVGSQHPEGKLARLHYQVIETDGKMSVVEIELETGRYHQIRAQFSAIGCPIIGDEKYGSTFPFHRGSIALHHQRLSFPHPITKQILQFNFGELA